MLVVEVGTLIVAAVTLILQRIDRRKDDVPGLREALIELHSMVRDWAAVAERVNEALLAADESGEPTSGPFDAFDGLRMQQAYAAAMQDQLLSDEAGGDRLGAAEILSVYAPEVQDALLKAAAIRRELVDQIMIDYGAAARAGEVREEELRATAEELRAAAEKLRVFISANFPVG